MVTKFNNQSHTHNLYLRPLQHAIASYSTEQSYHSIFEFEAVILAAAAALDERVDEQEEE